jgi:hypothetical protein
MFLQNGFQFGTIWFLGSTAVAVKRLAAASQLIKEAGKVAVVEGHPIQAGKMVVALLEM